MERYDDDSDEDGLDSKPTAAKGGKSGGISGGGGQVASSDGSKASSSIAQSPSPLSEGPSRPKSIGASSSPSFDDSSLDGPSEGTSESSRLRGVDSHDKKNTPREQEEIAVIHGESEQRERGGGGNDKSPKGGWKDAKKVSQYEYTKTAGEIDEIDEDGDGPSTSADAKSRPAQEYFENAEKNGISLPRQSGRYDDDANTNLSQKQNNNTTSDTTTPSFNQIAHKTGVRTPLVQCVIIRKKGIFDLYPSYELRLENDMARSTDDHSLLIVAMKQSMNRTSNYHYFDMTRGTIGQVFNKKSGNYMGKLRQGNQKLHYYLVGNSEAREEYSGIIFETENLLNLSGEGPRPRRVEVMLPRLNDRGEHVPYKPVARNNEPPAHLCDLLKTNNRSVLEPSFSLFHNKAPVLNPVNNSYQLNFNGRVTSPSVKNFQLVREDQIDDIILQFGKVDEDRYHLDFKAPFSAFQAFAIAVCQFDL